MQFSTRDLLKRSALIAASVVGLSASIISPTFADDAALKAKAYDTSLSDQERMAAITELTGFAKDPNKKYRVCIWDIIGRNGLIFTQARDQQLKLKEMGINVEMVPYTSETVLVEELKAGTCDAGLMTGLRARTFNKYTGTIDAIGGLIEWEQVQLVHRLIADPRSAEKMVEGDYVIMGLAPAGAAYVFVNDKEINSLSKAAGKRVAVLDYDPVQSKMIAGIGATPVVTDIVNAPNMFNNGNVDVLAAPLVAYEIMELHKGMEPKGGIINLPLTHISMQIVGRTAVFPNEVAQLMRESMYDAFDNIAEKIKAEEVKVPKKWWVEIPGEDKIRYEGEMQKARLQLRDEENYYHKDMLTLLRKIRCKDNPKHSECTNPVE